MNPEVARRTRATLELKLSEAWAKAVEIATERQRISFDAATGDATARKALDEANAASMTVNLCSWRTCARPSRRRNAVSARQACRSIAYGPSSHPRPLAVISPAPSHRRSRSATSMKNPAAPASSLSRARLA